MCPPEEYFRLVFGENHFLVEGFADGAAIGVRPNDLLALVPCIE